MYLLMAVNYLITFLLTPFVLKYLGQEQYSLWLLFFSIISYLSLSNLGFGNVFLVELPKKIGNKKEADILFNTFLFAYMAFCVISMLAVSVLYLNFNHIFKSSQELVETAKKTLLVFGLIFIVQFFQSLFESIIYVHGRLAFKNAVETCKVIANSLLTCLLLFYGYGVFELAIATLAVYVAGFLVVVYNAKNIMSFTIHFELVDLKMFARYFSPSWNYFIIMLSSQIIFYSDTWLISSLAGIKYVAAYALTYRLADVFIKMIFKLADAKNPKILSLSANGDYDALGKLHWRLHKLNIMAAIPSALFLAFGGVYVLRVWLGKSLDFDPSIAIVFSVMLLAHTIGHVSALFVIAMGIHKNTSYITMAEAVCNVVLSYILYQYLGVLGIALGTLISNLILSFWFVPFQFLQYIKSKQLS